MRSFVFGPREGSNPTAVWESIIPGGGNKGCRPGGKQRSEPESCRRMGVVSPQETHSHSVPPGGGMWECVDEEELDPWRRGGTGMKAQFLKCPQFLKPLARTVVWCKCV